MGLRARLVEMLERVLRSRVEQKTRHEILAALSDEGGWLFSQMKSGTTLICNAVAFYRARTHGLALDFSRIERAGVFRDANVTARSVAAAALAFRADQPRLLPLVQSHVALETQPRTTLLLTRDPRDYCASSLHFHFRQRAGRQRISTDRAITQMCRTYIRTAGAQAAVLDRAPETPIVRYEELIRDPAAVVGLLLERLGETVEPGRLAAALADTTPDRVAAHELQTGRAIVAGADFVGKHFVRSGRVGDFRDVFSKDEVKRIRSIVAEAGLPARLAPFADMPDTVD